VNTWPAPHPKRGEALDADAAAALLGITRNTLDVRLSRTRTGKARVAFPEPDGTARRPGGPVNFWWKATIEAHRDAWASRARRSLTADEVERIKRLHADGDSMHEISRTLDTAVVNVHRAIHGDNRRTERKTPHDPT
jgi:hypothetical protein